MKFFQRNNANQNLKKNQPSVGDSKIATFKDLKKVEDSISNFDNY